MKVIGLILVISLSVVILADWEGLAQEKKEKIMQKPEKTKEMIIKKKGMEEKEKCIEVEEMKPFYYCALKMTGSFEQHEAAFNKLYQAAGKQGLSMDAAPFGIYFNDPETTPEEQLKWEVGLPVKEDTEVEDPLVKKKWEYPMVVTMSYKGPFSEEAMGPAYSKLYAWISENNYTTMGPMAEKYLGMPVKNEEGELSGNVLIIVPVEKQAGKAKEPREEEKMVQ
jgi:AraC family transcriptional regulator